MIYFCTMLGNFGQRGFIHLELEILRYGTGRINLKINGMYFIEE